MDPVLAIGSPLSPLQAYLLSAREAASPLLPAPQSQAEPNPVAASSPSPQDPAREHQLMLHFISHIDAECFVSLLQILDPRPDDERDRAEYKRRYHQLREVLELPPPLPDPAPVGVLTDPLR